MKHLLRCSISLIITMLLFFNICTYAENTQQVTIGKVDFSMNKNDVSKATGATKEENTPDWDLLTPKEQRPSNVLYLNRTTFAGYDGATIIYSFNGEQLESVNIVFKMEETEKSSADRQFNALDEALLKYGNPIATGKEHIAFNSNAYDAIKVLQGCAFSGQHEGVMWYKHFSTEIIDSSQRLVDQGDSYVDIQLIEYNRNEDYEKVVSPFSSDHTYTDYYSVILSYTLCSKEQVDSIIDDAEQRNSSLQDDV